MPSYQVPLQGGGSMTVNASDPGAAADNVRAQGGNPAGAASNVGGVQPGQGMGPQNNTGGTQITNPTVNQQILNGAQAAAQQAYYNSRLQLDNDTLAFQKAQEAFNEEITKAGLTGQYQGSATQPALTNWAQLFGQWGAPTPGQQTLAGQQQGFTQGQDLAAMYGQYYAPGQTPTAGQTTQAAQQQAYNQWLQGQQLALSQQTQQQNTANQYLQMMAGLRGPADWIQYQKVLGAAPQGLQQLAAAAAGQYVPGGGATTGVQPQAVSLPGFINSATGGAFYGQQQPQGNTGMTTQAQYYNPQQAQGGAMAAYQNLRGTQAPVGGQQPVNQMQMQQAQGGAMDAYNQYHQQQPGQWSGNQQSLFNAQQIAQNQGYQQYGQPQGNTGMTTQAQYYNPQGGGYQNLWSPQQQGQQGYQQPMGSNADQTQAFQNSLVAPNQMAPQTWSALTPSQQQMLLGTWESKGYTQDDAKSLFSQSLPKYGAPSGQAGQFRLQ